ncbi:hypothetical protein JI721_16175 [Alicyclobacillus cycloheptanicus]|jgi:hypothetical protein|uniref:Uncharacterized protein n=1 Tax=Alicyclobacillus cycloheptanicus TaxID=1457 RepID=A0ABT9XDV9_9BACL|nr:hypothetical protein [Alicyclobacillus cycloheptanicus]MDQ0188481.1 hypothetical protein [Alicyclobacillus cycloheptanicus]WDM01170.1 hypothetical protein JI721_16175 [Alicyclobacillus cycloheptanicus]
MSDSRRSEDVQWLQGTEWVDRMLVPSAFGVLSVLVGVQMLTAIPAVRHHVDALAGRFVQVTPAAASSAGGSESASITLYLSPDTGPRPDVRVLVNGKYAGSFTSPSLHLTVHPNDQIEFVRSKTGGAVDIEVDDNDPNLAYPLPGMSYSLTKDDPSLDLPNVRFFSE